MSANKFYFAVSLSYFAIIQGTLSVINFFSLSKQSNLIIFITYLFGALWLLFLNQQLKCPLTFEKTVRLKLSTLFQYSLLGIVLSLTGQYLGNQVHYLLNSDLQISQEVANPSGESPLTLVTLIILGPIIEELFFRKVLTNLSAEFFSPLISGLISSAIFSFAHGGNFFFVYFFMGLAFYFIYRWSGSIWSAIISHIGMNLIVVLLSLN